MEQKNDDDQHNIRTACNWFGLNWIEKNAEAAKSLMTPDFIGHIGPEEVFGPEGMKKHRESIWYSFPDLELEIVDVISNDEKVILRFEGTGTFERDYFGVPSTGRKDNIQGINWIQITNGLVKEVWGMHNAFSVFQRGFKNALCEHKVPREILPICSLCKKIEYNKGNWSQIESYVKDRFEVDFSHSLCPECVKTKYPYLEIDV